jgi:hypothetical protein
MREEESLPRPTSLKVSLKSLNFWLESALIGEVYMVLVMCFWLGDRRINYDDIPMENKFEKL